MSNYKSLRYEVDGHLGLLTLNRPEKLNAIDDEMHEELLDAFLMIRGATKLRAVLMKAEGKAFSAGGDLDEVLTLQADFHKRTRMCETGQRIIHALIDIQVPVVTALHGDAMGLGASVALGGDIVVASKNARIADPHVKVGLVAGDGGVLFWPASHRHASRAPLSANRRHAAGRTSVPVRAGDRPRRDCRGVHSRGAQDRRQDRRPAADRGARHQKGAE